MVEELQNVSYEMRSRLLYAMGIGVAAVAGILIGKAVPTGTGVDNPALALSAALGLWGLLLATTWLWWRRIDDVQRQGQLVSWWWGGLSGALVTVAYLLATFGRHDELSLGASYVFFGQFAGYAIAWLIWRYRGRGEAE
ncbi:hypothetical protein [Sphingomonas sp. 35-24ZXX]|uniref:hypothetical protein n=1 Tax=Sphingomonas sp. 35-24ZXX TaxID=1545915 RepID=UPI00053C00D1|nr:hypothetical protein [Sphingomonas sp. 35-24ZXX]